MLNIIFVVETKTPSKNKRKQMKRRGHGSDYSDVQYLKRLMNYFFSNIPSNQISYVCIVCMNGKDNYNHSKTMKDIQHEVAEYKKVNDYPCQVIYVIDCDKQTASQQQAQQTQNVTNYCNQKDYPLIVFAKDIEHVLLGHSSKNKTIDAARFKVDKTNERSIKAAISKVNVTVSGSNFIPVIKDIFKNHNIH